MNVSTGLYRLAQVIKWPSRVLGGLLLIAVAYKQVFEQSTGGDAGVALVMTVVFMAIAEGIAWVLEGFAND